MIYVMLQGRLGNQLFQYAFARKISSLTHEEIFLDWSLIDHQLALENSNYWGRELNRLSIAKHQDGTGVNFPKLQELIFRLSRFIYRENCLKNFPKLRTIIYKFFSWGGMYLFRDGFINYTYFKSKNKYLYGYFESPRYFESVRDELIQEFTPLSEPLAKNRQLYNLINNNESICVSVRRGDFLDERFINFFGVCSIEYYQKGVEIIQKKYPDAIVVLFSDDIQWARDNLKFNADVYSETGDDPVWEKLRLMYSCKHFVISNSTFSWWVQYLSRNQNKIVVAPTPWRLSDNITDIMEDNWIIIER